MNQPQQHIKQTNYDGAAKQEFPVGSLLALLDTTRAATNEPIPIAVSITL
jgi:hypothetical protein